MAWGEGLFDVYKKSDIFILPSLTEGFPKTIFEAMAFGVPVIATDVGGISGIIKHEVNGILVKPKSSTGLVDAIDKICFNEDLYYKIIKHGYDTVKRFTIEKQHANMIAILKKYVAA